MCVTQRNAQRCENSNTDKIFIFGVVYSAKVKHELNQSVNRLLHEERIKYMFYCFIDTGVVSESDLWENEIHLTESRKIVVANIFINCLNNFLRPMNHVI